MKIKVKTETEEPQLIHPSQMANQAIAIVVEGRPEHIGALLTKHCDRLTIIGCTDYAVDGWDRSAYPAREMRVRVLKKGERVTLEVA